MYNDAMQTACVGSLVTILILHEVRDVKVVWYPKDFSQESSFFSNVWNLHYLFATSRSTPQTE